MILTCPNCDTRFKVPNKAIGAEGRQVRCAKCAYVWHAMPVEEEDSLEDVIAAAKEVSSPPPPPPEPEDEVDSLVREMETPPEQFIWDGGDVGAFDYRRMLDTLKDKDKLKAEAGPMFKALAKHWWQVIKFYSAKGFFIAKQQTVKLTKQGQKALAQKKAAHAAAKAAKAQQVSASTGSTAPSGIAGGAEAAVDPVAAVTAAAAAVEVPEARGVVKDPILPKIWRKIKRFFGFFRKPFILVAWLAWFGALGAAGYAFVKEPELVKQYWPAAHQLYVLIGQAENLDPEGQLSEDAPKKPAPADVIQITSENRVDYLNDGTQNLVVQGVIKNPTMFTYKLPPLTITLQNVSNELLKELRTAPSEVLAPFSEVAFSVTFRNYPPATERFNVSIPWDEVVQDEEAGGAPAPANGDDHAPEAEKGADKEGQQPPLPTQ